jgi:transcriptional regulator with XRE-family HTH domain/DNA-directed RNA polymerase subunit RPC12/RpoP
MMTAKGAKQMDQQKIGKFIAQCRKQAGLTQAQLAEKLSITDRAVSKWETGKALPDTSIMLELCQILSITVNDLLTGEIVTMEQYNNKLEDNLLEMTKQKQQADKHLLSLECLVVAFAIFILLATTIPAGMLEMAEWQRICMILVGLVPILVATPFMIKIEQSAGYYECAECDHRYVPTYKSVFFAAHMHTTRYMRCPKCGKKSWQKKVLTKE